jgi:hypothetical protein
MHGSLIIKEDSRLIDGLSTRLVTELWDVVDYAIGVLPRLIQVVKHLLLVRRLAQSHEAQDAESS